DVFLPYVRDEHTLARPWARPGTEGLEHRLGGLEKQHETGNVSYDPANHQMMTRLRAAKVERVAQDIPPTPIYGDDEGDLLLIGWGSTRGSIEAAIDAVRSQGRRVSSIHLRHLHPLPPDLGDIFARFERYLVPELNNGQLVRVLRDQFLRPFIPLDKVQGQPLRRSEVVAKIDDILSTDA
ncbi:MAG: 2-oxoglutarate ferredoxin oxidoreductase subunit alpha, partial [Bacteroidetes bacterium]|nr:2-oxoglutarate ferredoxin oxidoreductase subunit alpha [Bacteroidota bacterium]